MDEINKKNIKIGVICDTFLPQVGGAEIHVKNLAVFLKESGEKVKIFTNTPGEDYFDGIEVIRNKAKLFKPLRLIRDFKNLFVFIKSVDLVHAHYTFYLSFLSAIIARLLNKPVVVTLHGLGTLDSSVNKNFRRKIFRYFSFKLADAVIATSNEMADVARNFVPERKIYIIPNGVDTRYFDSDNRKKIDSKIIVLSARRLNPKNGVQYLIDSVPYVIKEFSNIEFWIAGKEKLEDYLRQRVKDLKIENFVKFIGEIPNNKIIEYYNGADIVTFPSSAESTSIACLEAMSMKKVIVASALEVFKEMLGDNERGLLVKLFNRESSDYDAPLTLDEERIKILARAIIEAAKNENLRLKLGENARKFVVENYDWRVLISKIEKIYFKLL